MFEQNEKLGKKIFITGKGRCNLTNACDMENLFRVRTDATRNFCTVVFMDLPMNRPWNSLKKLGLELKTERGEPGVSESVTILRT